LLYGRMSRGKLVMPAGELKVPKKYLEITDALYDLVEDTLKGLTTFKPDVGAPVVGKVKVKLPYYLASLDKMKPNEGTVAKFSAKNKGPYIVSDKLDGVSIAVVYASGKPTKAYTRGDGAIGGDISFLVPHLGLPSYKGDLALRGEVIMPKAKFEQFANEFRNPRNLTSGILNKKGVHPAIEHVDVVVYEVLSPRGVPSKQLRELKALGFHVVPHQVVSRISDEVLASMLKTRRARSHYELDGLVVAQDAKTTLPTDDNPSYAMAFKSDSEGNLAQSRVIKVWWEASKHRMLKPRVEIEPVELAGVDVKFATGINAKWIIDNRVGPGAIVELTRSGEVIPKILKVLKPAKAPQLPSEPYIWNKTKVDLLLAEDVVHTGTIVKQLSAFVQAGLGAEHVAEGILAKLYDAGFTNAGKLLRAKPADFLKVEGIKETMANKIYQQLQKGCAAADINAVAANCGIFGLGMGSRRIKLISDKYDLFKLSEQPSKQVLTKVLAIPGFSNITAKQFADNLATFIGWVEKLPIQFKKATPVKVAGSKMQGQAVCVSGFRNDALRVFVESQGGTFSESMKSNTTILIVKDKLKTSSKIENALSKGLKIYSLVEFAKHYGFSS